MRRFVNILIGSVLLLLGLAVLSVIGLHIFLKTGPGERIFLDTLNSFIPGRILSRTADISLLGQSAELTDGVLLGPDGKAVVRVEKLRVSIEYLALLESRIVFSSISAARPEFMLVMSGDNKLNLIEAVVEEEPSETEGFEVTINNLTAENGLVDYDDVPRSFHARLQRVSLKGSMDFSKPLGSIAAVIGEASVSTGSTRADFCRMTLRTSIDSELLSPVLVEAYRGRYGISVKGSIRDVFTRPVFDLTLDSGGPISDLASIFASEKSFNGDSKSSIRLGGTLDNPDCSGDIQYAGGKLAGVSVGRSSIDFGLHDRVLDISRVETDTAGGKAAVRGTIDLKEAFPKGFIESTPDYSAVSYTLSAELAGVNPRKIFPGEKAYPDNVSGTIDLSGKGLLVPDITAKASYAFHVRGAFSDSPVALDELSLKGDAVLDYPSLSMSTAGRSAAGISSDVKGSADLSSRTVQAHVNLAVQSIEAALPGGDDRMTGSLEASADISGPIERPVISADIKGRNLKWQGYLLGEAEMEAGLDGTGTLSIANLTVNNGEPVLTAHGRVRVFRKGFSPDPLMPVLLDARLQSSDLKRLTVREDVKGSVEGDIHIEGELLNPSGSIRLAGNGIGIGGIGVGDVRLDGGISDGIFKVVRASLTNGSSVMNASGLIHILDAKTRRIIPDPEIAVDIEGSSLKLEDFTADAEGTVSLSAHIDGSVKNPQGRALLSGTGIDIAGQTISEARIDSVMADRRISVESLEILVRPGQAVSGTGWVSLEKGNEYSVSLSSAGIALDSLPCLKPYRVTSGRLVFDVSGRGSLEAPKLNGSVRIVDLAVNNQRLKDISIGLNMDGWKVNLFGENSFGFNGVYDVKAGDLALEALFESTELSPYFAIAGRPDLSGLLNASAEVKGNVYDLENIDLFLYVSGIDVSYMRNNLLSAHDLTVRYRNRRLVIPRSRVYLMDKGDMMLQAATDLKGGLDLKGEGAVPLEILAAFDPDLADLGGMLRFDVAASGPITAPAVGGDIYLDNVQYAIPFNGQTVHGANGHIRLANDRLVIESLAGQVDTGHFAVQGTIGLDRFSPADIDLNINARSLPVNVPDTLDLLLETNLRLTGTADDSLLSGNAVILEGQYYRDVQLNLIAEVGQRITGARPGIRAPREPIDLPYLRNMALNVSVSRRGSVTIENNLVDAAISPDLQITGTLNAPVVTGRVSVTSGTVTYQKRTFDITKGVVDFSNPYRTEPVVDIGAEGRVREWTIYLAVSGPLDNLNIQLTSNPPAENAVILSLLATGKTPEEFVSRPGTTASSPSNLLAELLASTYGGKVKETTGLDILQLETEAPVQAGQTEGIKITVGEELTRRLTVKYSIETRGNEMTRATIAEYKFLENILLNGFQDSKGAFGADVQFRLEFR